MDTLYQFRVTDRFSRQERYIELLGEDSLRGYNEARWTAFAMASGTGMDPDYVTLEGVEI